MKALVWAEHDGVALKYATLSAVTAADQLGEVALLAAGLMGDMTLSSRPPPPRARTLPRAWPPCSM